jgi:hypothetical protein
MNSKFLLSAVLLFGISVITAVQPAQSQNRFDALRFSQTSPVFDPSTMALGGASVTRFAGLGAYALNPATVALADQSMFLVGLGARDVQEDATYLNTRTSFNDEQISISNVSYLYRFPTIQGSMVFGGGYTMLADFNRASSLNAFNDSHTIVDFFLRDPGDQYFETAFNAFAIEYDDTFDEYFNVLRADGDFRGMNQYMELRERGQIGEYSLFFGTEFQQGFYFGASLGIIAGDYGYRRSFVEEDLAGRYIDAPFDVDVILTEDRIDASMRGANFRVGALYEPIDGIRLGLSFNSRSVLEIDEDYSTFIRTDYYSIDGDGANRYEDTYRGKFSYKVRRPSSINAGIGIGILPFADIEVSAERINYSRLELEGLGTIRDRDENMAIRSDFNDVVNLRGGVTLNISDNVKPRFGYAFHPSPRRAFNADISYLSAGASVEVSQGITFDFGFQYAMWDDELDVYRYSNTGVASMRQEVTKVQGLFGLTFAF